MYFVYLLLCADASIYTGITTDVERRLVEHKNGKGGNYTRSHKIKKLLYTERVEDKSAALKREAQIKKWTRLQKLQMIQDRAAAT